MEKRPKLVILQAKKPVNLQLFFTVYGKGSCVKSTMMDINISIFVLCCFNFLYDYLFIN